MVLGSARTPPSVAPLERIPDLWFASCDAVGRGECHPSGPRSVPERCRDPQTTKETQLHRPASLFFAGFALVLIVVSSPALAANDTEASPLAKGVVKALDPNAGTVTLDHEDIPGVMMAMTMTYPVANPELLKDIEVGQSVEFRLRKDGDDFVVTEIKPSKQATRNSHGMSCCSACDGMDRESGSIHHEMHSDEM